MEGLLRHRSTASTSSSSTTTASTRAATGATGTGSRRRTGTQWLTIPVRVKGKYDQRIDETLSRDPSWAEKHWRTLDAQLRGGAALRRVRASRSRRAYRRGRPTSRVSARSTARCSRRFCGVLGIETTLSWSTDYEAEGAKTERLVILCRAAGAATYLSGPRARRRTSTSSSSRRRDRARVRRLRRAILNTRSSTRLRPRRHGARPVFNTGPRSAALHEELPTDGTTTRCSSDVERYYTRQARRARRERAGVDWSSDESQRLRFVQLLTVADGDERVLAARLRLRLRRARRRTSTRDGRTFALPRLRHLGRRCSSMRARARLLPGAQSALVATRARSSRRLHRRERDLQCPARTTTEEWRAYVLEHASTGWTAVAARGFAFNMLTSYSDPRRMRPDLYYADPLAAVRPLQARVLASCRAAARLRALYEFTIVVRRED